MTIKDNDNLVAIIAEGNTEQAIFDVLIKHNAIKYSSDELLQEEIIRCRSGKSFAKKYLNKSIGKKVLIYRVLDSRKENFKLPPAYKEKVSNIINLYTHPEIEILFILYHGDYQKFKNQKGTIKASTFVKENYHDLTSVKAYDDNFSFWDEHFSDLIKALKLYKSYNSNNDHCIADLLVH